MAEVSITLDNSEGWLPVDYSEVVVSRRAYRSGESEYLINKSQGAPARRASTCSMRAQVGQNSYAFMGQGLVDEVLVMRPEERRRCWKKPPTCACCALASTKRATGSPPRGRTSSA